MFHSLLAPRQAINRFIGNKKQHLNPFVWTDDHRRRYARASNVGENHDWSLLWMDGIPTVKLRPRDYRKILREKLLPITLKHAEENVSGYSQLWGDQQLPHKLEHLDWLPLVFKEQMLENTERFRDPHSDVAAVQNTGGTTGRKLELHRCSAELEYIRAFYTNLQLTSNAAPSHAPHCITAMGSYHGASTPVPYFGPITALDLTLPANQDRLSEIFSSCQDELPSSLFVGFESQLRIATCKLIEAGFDFRRSCVRAIVVTGELVTNRLRRFYEDTWGVPVRSRYSMSEVFGGASVCNGCGTYHCDPHIVAEIVNPFTLKTEMEGYGILVLTCLYPFLQKQPMIRYFTGDVIYGRQSTCDAEFLGFRLEGRLQSCILENTINGTALLISGHCLYNILDEFPDVNTAVVHKHVSGVADRSVLGHLKVRLSATEEAGTLRDVTVFVEMRYAPYAYKDRIDNVISRVRESLIERSPLLQRRIAAGNIRLNVVPTLPGTLSAFYPDEVE